MSQDIISNNKNLNNSYKITNQYSIGTILPHYKKIQYYNIGYNKSINIEIAKKKNDNLKYNGLGLRYIKYKHLQLGYSIDLYYIYDKEIRLNKKMSYEYNIGIGMAYNSEIFDANENNKNILTSSHLNLYIHFQNKFNIYLSDKININTALSLYHTSNGAIRKPNLGINALLYSIGFDYLIDYKKNINNDKQYKLIDNNKKNEILLGIGLTSNDIDKDIFFAIPNISFYRRILTKKKFNLSIGVDYFYNENISYINSYNEIQSSKLYNNQIGISGLVNLYSKNLEFTLLNGFYLFNHNFDKNIIYHKIIVKKLITKNIKLYFGLKTHFAVAEYFNLGMNFCF